VVTIAGRYLREGYSVEFEPNGRGGSDLLVSLLNIRLYVEVKRENWRDQRKSLRMMERAHQVLEAVNTVLKEKLDSSGKRVEIQFPNSFSSETIPAICSEISSVHASGELAHEVPLHTIRGSRMIIMSLIC
jgi:hypothetical protein